MMRRFDGRNPENADVVFLKLLLVIGLGVFVLISISSLVSYARKRRKESEETAPADNGGNRTIAKETGQAIKKPEFAPPLPGRSFEHRGIRYRRWERSENNRYMVAADAFIIGSGGRILESKCIQVDLQNESIQELKGLQSVGRINIDNLGRIFLEDHMGKWGKAGTVVFFGSAGKRLWRKRFKAPIRFSGISSDWSRAFVQTDYSDDEDDSKRLFFLSMENGEIIWKTYGVDGVRFQKNSLVVEDGKFGEVPQIFAFDEKGNLPEEYKLLTGGDRDPKRMPTSIEGMLAKVKESMELESPDTVTTRRLFEKLENKKEEMNKKQKAQYLRYLGELSIFEGEPHGALLFWNEALQLDPDVGVEEQLNVLQSKFESLSHHRH